MLSAPCVRAYLQGQHAVQHNIAAAACTTKPVSSSGLVSPDCSLLAELVGTSVDVHDLISDKLLRSWRIPSPLQGQLRMRGSGWESGGRHLAIPFDQGDPAAV